MATVKEADIVIAKFDYKATDKQELNIQKGEKLTLLDDTQHWWKVMNAYGDVGYVPSNYVKRSKQGLFSSLRNTLGRRKSRSDFPPTATGASTGGRPPAPAQPSTRNGGSAGSKTGVKASAESLDYVAPSLPSSGSASGQSPSRSVATSIGYQPVTSTFPSNGTATVADTSRSSAFLPSSRQLPPTHPGMLDVALQRNQTDSRNCPNSGWGTASANVGPPSRNTDTSAASVRFSGTLSPINSSGCGGGGSISSRQICVARFNYKASQPDELTIQPGDRLCVLEKSSDGWWHGMLIPPADGTTDTPGQQQHQPTIGWFPSNYVFMEIAPNKPVITGIQTTCQPAYLTPTPPPFPPMPTASMGAKTSAPLPVATKLAPSNAVAGHVSIPSSSSAPTDLPPTSFASYSAVPFPAPTPSTSNAFAPSMNPQVQQPHQQHYHQIPSNAVTAPAFIDNPIGSAPNEQFEPYRETVLTLYPFNRTQVEELSFNVDEILEVLDKPADDPDWWRCRNAVGNVGLVPRNYIRGIGNTAPVPYHAPPIPTNTFQQIASTSTAAIVSPHAEKVRRKYVMTSPNASKFLQKPWYWGSISRSECELLLTNLGAPGEFFVRDSETHPGDLTITMNAGSKNRNFKVHMKDGEFYIGLKVFTSLDALIDNYRRHPIFKNEQEKHFLTQPFCHPECDAFLSSANAQVNPLMQSR